MFHNDPRFEGHQTLQQPRNNHSNDSKVVTQTLNRYPPKHGGPGGQTYDRPLPQVPNIVTGKDGILYCNGTNGVPVQVSNVQNLGRQQNGTPVALQRGYNTLGPRQNGQAHCEVMC